MLHCRLGELFLPTLDSFYRGLTAEESASAQDYNFDHPGLETNQDKSKCQQQFDNYKECKKREVHLCSPILSSLFLMVYDGWLPIGAPIFFCLVTCVCSVHLLNVQGGCGLCRTASAKLGAETCL
nr:uncharacterized protein LOC109733640 [Aegilops tauschii subsp. strangulata]